MRKATAPLKRIEHLAPELSHHRWLISEDAAVIVQDSYLFTAEGANSHTSAQVHRIFLPKVRIRTFPWAVKR